MPVNKMLNIIQNNPLHRFLDIDIFEDASQNTVITTVVKEHLTNPGGTLHGGVIYALCDACASGFIGTLPEGQHAVTHDIHVSVMRPAALGAEVTFTSNIVKQGKSLCFVDVRVEVAGNVIATARVTKSIVAA